MAGVGAMLPSARGERAGVSATSLTSADPQEPRVARARTAELMSRSVGSWRSDLGTYGMVSPLLRVHPSDQEAPPAARGRLWRRVRIAQLLGIRWDRRRAKEHSVRPGHGQRRAPVEAARLPTAAAPTPLDEWRAVEALREWTLGTACWGCTRKSSTRTLLT